MEESKLLSESQALDTDLEECRRKCKGLEQKLLETEEKYKRELNLLEEEKKRVKELAIQACRLSSIGDLIAGIAHDLNNPLSGIMLKAELLKFEFEEGTENFQELDRILELSDRIAKTVKELSLFTKQGRNPKVKLRLIDVFRNSLSLLNNRINKNRIRIVQDIDVSLPSIYGRHQDLQQLFVNLINNSCIALNDKFGEEANPEKKIIIAGKTEIQNGKNFVIISIKDNGVGITKENLDKVFDLFFSTRRQQGSFGVGLSICREIMNDHHGKIYIQSHEGEYTIVTLQFPA